MECTCQVPSSYEGRSAQTMAGVREWAGHMISSAIPCVRRRFRQPPDVRGIGLREGGAHFACLSCAIMTTPKSPRPASPQPQPRRQLRAHAPRCSLRGQQPAIAVGRARAPPFPVRGDRCGKLSAKPSCERRCGTAHSPRNLGSVRCDASPRIPCRTQQVDRGAAARQPGSRPASSSRQADSWIVWGSTF
jgi:hypothetical protein